MSTSRAVVGENVAAGTVTFGIGWLRKGFWAVADQGLFATANFAVSVLLARWLPPSEYGAFTIAYATFLLLGTAHTALLTEPLLVFGSQRYERSFDAYLRVLLRGHWLLSVGAGILLATAALVSRGAGEPALAAALLGIAIAAPLILFSWLVRRACFARFQPQRAAAAGAVHISLMLAAITLLAWSRTLTVLTALLAIGFSSLIAGALILRGLLARQVHSEPLSSREVFEEHRRYGRWALASGAMSWVPGNVFFLLLPAVGGLQATAALRALLNLILPIQHGIAALGTLLVPTLGRLRRPDDYRHVLWTYGAVFMAGALAYWLAIGLLARSIIALLYAGQYAEHAHLLWVAGALPLVTGAVAVAGAALRSLQRPDAVFWAYVASGVVALTAGAFLTLQWGLAGALIGSVLASITTAVMLGLSLRTVLS